MPKTKATGDQLIEPDPEVALTLDMLDPSKLEEPAIAVDMLEGLTTPENTPANINPTAAAEGLPTPATAAVTKTTMNNVIQNNTNNQTPIDPQIAEILKMTAGDTSVTPTTGAVVEGRQAIVPTGPITTMIPARDVTAIATYFLTNGVDKLGVVEIVEALKAENVISTNIEVLRVTQELIDTEDRINIFRGSVGLLNNAKKLVRGFTFREDLAQEVFLVKCRINSTLDGLSEMKTRYGSVEATFMLTPNVKGGIPKKPGTTTPDIPAARCLLRMLVQQITDEGDWINPYLQNTVRGANSFGDHAPAFVYEAGRWMGLPEEWFNIRKTTRVEIKQRQMARQNGNRNAMTGLGDGASAQSFGTAVAASGPPAGRGNILSVIAGLQAQGG